MNQKGILIDIEGIDGAGKASNIKLLNEYLNNLGYKIVNYSFPQYETAIGKVIANYLCGKYGLINEVSNELICIAYAADRLKCANDIKHYLENGYIVLCDRLIV